MKNHRSDHVPPAPNNGESFTSPFSPPPPSSSSPYNQSPSLSSKAYPTTTIPNINSGGSGRSGEGEIGLAVGYSTADSPAASASFSYRQQQKQQQQQQQQQQNKHKQHASDNHHHQKRYSDSRLAPLGFKSSEDFVGAPFDGNGILSHLEATRSPTYQQKSFTPSPQQTPASATHRPPPPPLSNANPEGQGLGHYKKPLALRRSASFTADRANMMSEKSQGPKVSETQSSTPTRYSDEGKEPKGPGVLRKKSGFSGLMSTLVGSQKKPVISAPENPVHVTHVGYDSSTGQFTVRNIPNYICPCVCVCVSMHHLSWISSISR